MNERAQRASLLVLFLILLPVPASWAAGPHWTGVGPYGGIVTTIVEDSRGSLIAGTDGGGIFKSSDNGDSWRPVSSGLDNPSVFRLAISRKGKVFAGTKDGLYESTDGGESWSLNREAPGGALVPSIFVDRDGTVYISVWGSGVYRSRDEGATWQWLKEGLSAPQVNQITADRDTLYAATDYGIYRRPKGDGGIWRSFGNTEEHVVSAAVVDKDGNLFCTFWAAGLYRWMDNEFKPFRDIDPYSRYLALDKDGNLYAASETGVYRLNADERVGENIGLEKTDVQCLLISRSGRIFAGTFRQGLFVKDGPSWRQSSKGIINTRVLSLAIDGKGTIYAGALGGLFTKTGDRWQEHMDLNNEEVHDIFFTDDGEVLVATNHVIFRKEGKGWSRIKDLWGYNIQDIERDDSGNLYIATDGDGVLVSSDKGATWKPLNDGLFNPRVMTFFLDSKRNLYCGTYEGVFMKQGSGWVHRGLKDYKVSTIAQAGDGTFYAGTGRAGVFISKDNMKTWGELNSGLASKVVDVITLGPDSRIYAGTFKGLHVLSGDGSTWKDVTGDLVNRQIRAIVFDGAKKILVGTFGGGVSVSGGVNSP